MIPSGEEAEKAFNKLRDRYVRARKRVRSVTSSGVKAKTVINAENRLKEMAYFTWIEEFIKPRKGKNNIKKRGAAKREMMDDSDSENDEDDFGEQNDLSEDEPLSPNIIS